MTISVIPIEKIINNIFLIRNEKVILDSDLAKLYGVETRTLKQAVRRNIERFPEDFMFELAKEEFNEVITICDNLENLKFSPARPFAFTEQGVAMLSSVLKSKRAVEVNIAIMRAFVKLRKILDSTKSLSQKIKELEESTTKKIKEHDKQISLIFETIQKLIHEESKPKRRIGF